MGRIFPQVFFGLANFEAKVSNPASMEAVRSKAAPEASKPLGKIGVHGDVHRESVRVLYGIMNESGRIYPTIVIEPTLLQYRPENDQWAQQMYDEHAAS